MYMQQNLSFKCHIFNVWNIGMWWGLFYTKTLVFLFLSNVLINSVSSTLQTFKPIWPDTTRLCSLVEGWFRDRSSHSCWLHGDACPKYRKKIVYHMFFLAHLTAPFVQKKTHLKKRIKLIKYVHKSLLLV